jgi:hypothetical protein
MDDLISRADAIRWVKTECNPYGKPTLDFESGKKVIEHLEQMPPAQPMQTDKDFEKQIHAMFDHIWDCEIEHPIFQDTVGDLMKAVIQAHNNSAQQEIIRCKDCRWHNGKINQCNAQICASMCGEDFCSRAERRQDD